MVALTYQVVASAYQVVACWDDTNSFTDLNMRHETSSHTIFLLLRYCYQRDSCTNRDCGLQSIPVFWMIHAQRTVCCLPHLEHQRAHMKGYTLHYPCYVLIPCLQHQRAYTLICPRERRFPHSARILWKAQRPGRASQRPNSHQALRIAWAQLALWLATSVAGTVRQLRWMPSTVCDYMY